MLPNAYVHHLISIKLTGHVKDYTSGLVDFSVKYNSAKVGVKKEETERQAYRNRVF